MKNKKRILNFGASLIVLVVCTFAFLNWRQTDKVQSDFRAMEIKLYQSSLTSSSCLLDSLVAIEQQINQFTLLNPVPENIALGDFASNTEIASKNITDLYADFTNKVYIIDDFYRKSERQALLIFLVGLILGNVALLIMKHYIKKPEVI